MLGVNLCRECGVPEPITRDNLWLNSGALVQSSDTTRRMGFIESENLGPVYTRIGEIIGMPIDHLVMDIARKGTVEYISNITPPEVREAARSGGLDTRALAEALFFNGQILGFGANEVVDLKEDEYLVVRVTEPFCIELAAGMLSGGCEAVTGALIDSTYRETSPGVYELTAHFTDTHKEDSEGRLQPLPYHHREGDIKLERCATCGGPKALSKFNWNLSSGKIINTMTSRRMALIGPEVQDPLFDELEAELGDTIPRVVVDAQKEFVKTGAYSIEEIRDEGDLHTQIALRGLGSLQEVKMGANRLYMHIDNASGYLMTIGMVQGLFEMALDVESFVDWELSENGDLKVEVSPRGLARPIRSDGS